MPRMTNRMGKVIAWMPQVCAMYWNPKWMVCQKLASAVEIVPSISGMSKMPSVTMHKMLETTIQMVETRHFDQTSCAGVAGSVNIR